MEKREEMERSPQAVKKCAEWLAYCLKIGYAKEDLDKLEKIWWHWKRDKMGNLIQSLQESEYQLKLAK